MSCCEEFPVNRSWGQIKPRIVAHRNWCAAIFLLSTSSCTGVFLTSHQAFVEVMNRNVKNGSTIDEISANKGGYQLAGERNFISKENKDNGTVVYHYAYLNTSRRYCKYNFVVDTVSKTVIGWGFDSDIEYAKFNCGRGG